MQFSFGYGQDLHQKGRLFLQSKSSSPDRFTSGFSFSKETNNGNQTILEASDPECYIIFQSSRKDTVIVAYSTRNVFTRFTDSILPGASGLIKSISNTPIKKLHKTGMSGKLPIGPLLETTWNQDDWYNRLCPYNINCPAGENAYVGCIAVAMGQIIKYYGKWNDFTIDASYTYKGMDLSAYSTDYEWAGMINSPVNYDLEVCKMLYDLGVLVNMNYGHQSSSQSTGKARIGFNLLGYENAYTAPRHNFTDEEWLEEINSSLIHNSPIFVSGGGHAFVCDGYDEEGLLHFNLGWGGFADGYYHPSSVGNKIYLNEAILNLIPENEFESPHSLRIEKIDFKQTICWSPPNQWGNPSSYRVYYSDDNFFIHQDTCIDIEDLIPGYLSVKVSAIYPDGESLWIGPVSIFNPGADLIISDTAFQNAIKKQLEADHHLLDSNISSIGKIANLKSLSIETPVSSLAYFNYMPNLQEISLNAKGLKLEDLSFLENLDKLQSLRLANIDIAELPDLGKCKKLVQLMLDSCIIENLNFLSDLENLVVLDISSCELDNLSLPDCMVNLEKLRINDVSFSSPLQLNAGPNLRSIEISGAGLGDFYPDIKNERLSCLKLDNNALTNMGFLAQFPNLKYICLAGNNISKLEIHSPLQHLLQLDLSRNKIDKVSMSFDFHSLVYLNLSHNNFREFPGIFKHLPNLSYLDISNNFITKLPSMRLPYLRELKLANNNMNHLNGIELYEALKNLDIKGNSISDFSPLIQSDNYMSLKTLDLRQNPVSKESFEEVIPYLDKNIEQFYSPSGYEGKSPCYPSPLSPTKVSNREMKFSWYCEDHDNNTKYDFYLGIGDSTRLINQGLRDQQLTVRLKDDQKYRWQVVSHFADSSYYSGLYDIRTTKDLELPYHENFNSYTVGQGITNSSSNWRLTNGISDEYQDADISLKNSSLGFGKSLHIQSTSNISIDLDHIDISTLVIEYDQFIQGGRMAHVRLKNMHGLQIDIYSNSFQSLVYTNGSLSDEFDVLPNQWNHFRISIQGSNERVFVRCNNQTIVSKKWLFKNSKAQIESIIFSNDQPGDGTHFTNFESYIDNLSIYDANNRTAIDNTELNESEIGLFPNPANNYISILGLPADQRSLSMDILDSHGRILQNKQFDGAEEEYTITVDHLPSGVYYYRINNSLETHKSGKFLISR